MRPKSEIYTPKRGDEHPRHIQAFALTKVIKHAEVGGTRNWFMGVPRDFSEVLSSEAKFFWKTLKQNYTLFKLFLSNHPFLRFDFYVLFLFLFIFRKRRRHLFRRENNNFRLVVC